MSFQSDYGFLDRVLHRLAFASWPVQAAVADMEEAAFKDRLAGVTLDRPVFVSGLPRAGTTLLLQLIEGAGEFASYHYSDMPFLLTPMFWNGMTGSAKRHVEVRERAHGDGVEVGIDSAEAFEEVVWRTLYPKKYLADRIQTWRGAIDADKARFVKSQMRKIVAIRSRDGGGPLRYLSKANGNIARFATIAGMMPDAIILAPYRRPLAHARSLLRQHQNFLEMHRSDRFAREYMGAIGHYDFGMNLKPINFDGWLDQGPVPDFTGLNAWVAYWCAAYEFLLRQTGAQVRFFSYNALCEDPKDELESLEAALGLSRPGLLSGQIAAVRGGGGAEEAAADIDPGLLKRANAVFEELEGRRGRREPLRTRADPWPARSGRPQRRR